MLDFSLVRRKEKTLNDLAAGLSLTDLYRLTDEMIDLELEILDGVADADVIFVPFDEQANDPYAKTEDETRIAWTLGHIVVHATASAEEAAMQALSLARGVPVNGRSRYEVPWESITSAAQARSRLEESRRMRRAMLDAWPDSPHLEVTFTAGYPGAVPVNAVGRFLSGLLHEDSHLEQLREVVRQGAAYRQAAAFRESAGTQGL